MDGVSTIFVFGSNLAGRHGKGAALEAMEKHAARYGQGVGPQGQAYAIPTKDAKLRVLPLDDVRWHVDNFLEYARSHSELRFQLTAIGCGLAGYKPEQIAPMFRDAPINVIKPKEFEI